MSDINQLILRVQREAHNFTRATTEQALTYACENVADDVLNIRVMTRNEIQPWVDNVCHAEDLDVPDLEFRRKRPTSLAVTFIDQHSVCLYGREIRQSTILHELSHLSTKAENHGVLFRNELVRLTRAHLSLDYAALLHALFKGCNLEIGPWGASARQY